jgi:hypothetical protein
MHIFRLAHSYLTTFYVASAFEASKSENNEVRDQEAEHLVS